LKLRTGEYTAAARICKADWSTAGTTHLIFNVLAGARITEKVCRVSTAARHPVHRKVVETALAVSWVSLTISVDHQRGKVGKETGQTVRTTRSFRPSFGLVVRSLLLLVTPLRPSDAWLLRVSNGQPKIHY
jgi:hypothetical protein